MTAKRPQDWSAEEKLAAVIEAASVAEGELGAFLRTRGLHQAQLQEWRQRLLASLSARPAGGAKRSQAEARRIRQLEQELTRKEKALAEAAALLMLKKKGSSGITVGSHQM
jgi:transposase-like protein